MDSFGVANPTYSGPRTICHYSVRRRSSKERDPAIEGRCVCWSGEAETVFAVELQPRA